MKSRLFWGVTFFILTPKSQQEHYKGIYNFVKMSEGFTYEDVRNMPTYKREQFMHYLMKDLKKQQSHLSKQQREIESIKKGRKTTTISPPKFGKS